MDKKKKEWLEVLGILLGLGLGAGTTGECCSITQGESNQSELGTWVGDSTEMGASLTGEFGVAGALGITSAGFTTTEVTSEEPIILVFLKKDSVPYTVAEKRAALLHSKLRSEELPVSSAPVFAVAAPRGMEAVQDAFGPCSQDRILETLETWERLLENGVQ